jgi:cellulase/cellobiase CelA1
VTPPPSIVVTFRIDNNWGSGFTAEIDVTNNRSTPISGWEIVVALPQDQFTGWRRTEARCGCTSTSTARRRLRWGAPSTASRAGYP